MMKMRLILLLGMLALVFVSAKAEDPQAEPESAAAEPAAEPEAEAGDAKHSGSSKSETKASTKNPAPPRALSFSVPAILSLTALTVVAKCVL